MLCNLATAQDTMYFYKSGVVKVKQAISDIDSVIISGKAERVKAAYVLNSSGLVVASFGYPGSKGKLSLSSLPEIPDTITCRTENVNPLQAALLWARSNNFRDVRLDAATYTFDVPQVYSFLGKIGFRVPSNIHLKGVMINGVPVSVLAPSQSLVDKAKLSASKSSFDILLLPFDSPTGDVTVLTNNTTIESIFIDNKNAGAVCMWANGGDNFKLLSVYAQASNISSLILGFYYSQENPKLPYTIMINYARNFEIAKCRVLSANGDAICAIGKKGIVHDNICENGNKTGNADNGLTCFIGSDSIQFIDNQIHDFTCGIGLDGSYLPPNLPGKSAEASLSLCLQKEKELYRHWTGYNRNIEIARNSIWNCNRGIVLWRGTNISIHDNTVTDCLQEGISLEESMQNNVWNNQIKGCNIACRLTSSTESALDENGKAIGTSNNKIGYNLSGGSPGNNYSYNNIGIQFYKPVPAQGWICNNLFINNDVSHCKSSMPTDNVCY